VTSAVGTPPGAGRGDGQFDRQRLCRHQFLEQPPLLIDAAADGKGCLAQDRVRVHRY
jgi:hypothetical protein